MLLVLHWVLVYYLMLMILEREVRQQSQRFGSEGCSALEVLPHLERVLPEGALELLVEDGVAVVDGRDVLVQQRDAGRVAAVAVGAAPQSHGAAVAVAIALQRGDA